MGEIRKYTCSCGYEKDLFVGAGLQGVNINAVGNYFSEDAVNRFRELRECGEVRSYLLENAVISCTDCQELATVPYFHYELADGEEKVFLSSCPACEKLTDGIINPDSVICPKCGREMEFVPIGDWD